MAKQRLTGALEKGDPEAIAAAFDPDVRFDSPVHTRPLRGREQTLQFFGMAEQVVQGLTYYDSIENDDRALMFWRGLVRERPIEGTTLISVNDEGLVSHLAVLMRSWLVVGLFRDALLRGLADVFPLQSWESRPDPGINLDPGAGVGQPAVRMLAPNVQFHSPMLTKTVNGEEHVDAVHKLIGGIQGQRQYHWRVESDTRVAEYWSCLIEGHLQSGIDRLDLDDAGHVLHQRVWLAPWPVTTLLRDRAIAAQPPSLDADFWLAPAYPTPLA
jgi:hypothetical protein